MTTSQTSPDTPTPELDALSTYLGANPDEIAAFTETPFSLLLDRVHQLGFDSTAVQVELAETCILDLDIWLSADPSLELSGFLKMSPAEYSELYPDRGAPLVASVLNSIHLSEEQASLQSVAGGTKLSKGDDIAIASVAGVVTAFYLAPRVVKSVLRNKRFSDIVEQLPAKERENFVAYAGKWRRPTEGGSFGEGRYGKFLGFTTSEFRADSIRSRLMHEWNQSLGGLIHKFEPPQPEPEPDNDSDIKSTVLSEAETEAQGEIETSFVHLAKDGAREASNSEVVSRNMNRAFDDPSRELGDLSDDFSALKSSGVRPKSVGAVANKELDSFVIDDIGSSLQNEFNSGEINSLRSEANEYEGSIADTEKKMIANGYDEARQSVLGEARSDANSIKRDASGEIEHMVSDDEQIARDAVGTEISDAEGALEEDGKNAVGIFEEHIDNAASKLD